MYGRTRGIVVDRGDTVPLGSLRAMAGQVSSYPTLLRPVPILSSQSLLTVYPLDKSSYHSRP